MVQEVRWTLGLYSPTSWTPMTDVYENGEQVVVVVDIAGVDKNQLKITLDGRTLYIAGRRQSPFPSASVTIRQMEIDAGEFSRRILLPGFVIFDKSECTYKDGLLRIVLPKRREGQVTHIPIESE